MIFISHDTRDADLAEAFSRLLAGVSAGVLKSFRSSDRRGEQGMEYGVDWYPEIMSKLSEASDVVCLLTSRSLDRPWILYEAGVAKGRLDTPVLGLALGIPLSTASTGPFAQFQNTSYDIESITRLVMQLVLKRVPNAAPDYDAFATQVRVFKDQADELLKELEAPVVSSEVREEADGETAAKLFEEVKVMFQDLPARLEDRVTRAVRPQTKRTSHPFGRDLLYEADRLSKERPNRHWGLLYLVTSMHAEWPWLYELGMEVYRNLLPSNAIHLPTKSRTGPNLFRQKRTKQLINEWKELATATLELHLGSKSTNKGAQQFLSELPPFIDYYMDFTGVYNRISEAEARSGIEQNDIAMPDA